MADRRQQDKDEKLQIVKDLQYSPFDTILRSFSLPRNAAPSITPPRGFTIRAPEPDIIIDHSPAPDFISSLVEFLTFEIKYRQQNLGFESCKVPSSDTDSKGSEIFSDAHAGFNKVELAPPHDPKKRKPRKPTSELYEGRHTYSWDLEDTDESDLDGLFSDDDSSSEKDFLPTYDEKISEDSYPISEPFFDPTFHGVASLTDDLWTTQHI